MANIMIITFVSTQNPRVCLCFLQIRFLYRIFSYNISLYLDSCYQFLFHSHFFQSVFISFVTAFAFLSDNFFLLYFFEWVNYCIVWCSTETATLVRYQLQRQMWTRMRLRVRLRISFVRGRAARLEASKWKKKIE